VAHSQTAALDQSGQQGLSRLVSSRLAGRASCEGAMDMLEGRRSAGNVQEGFGDAEALGAYGVNKAAVDF
jgi:hypothetical protein